MPTSREIRDKFLRFFEERGHTVVASDLLVPRGDPTLLFTGAGMNQFKDEFMGRNITYKRAVSCQKCLRTGDLENVGRTPRHHTFFEMLGNFSFGDYFKREAIRWAWEFMTGVMSFPPKKLWVSVYKDDEESYSIWSREIKVPEGRIVRLGTRHNFWPQDAPTDGPDGPCGPCSEIFYDWGEDAGCGNPGCGVSCDCGRFIEVWNLVFTEFERKPDGSLVPLPNKNIDTGMGLERLVSVTQGARTNFDTDIFASIKKKIREELGSGGVKEASVINLVADHIRAVVFAIADGVSPSNEKQGYVVRKLIRRAWLKGGIEKGPFLFKMVPAVTAAAKDVYPELEAMREHIAAIVKEEEKRFKDTLLAVFPVMDEMFSGSVKVLGGEEVFKLVDTYGMPLEYVKFFSESKYGAGIDMDGFDRLMEERREESRRGSNIASGCIFQPDLFKGAPDPAFSDVLPLEADLVFMVKDGVVTDEIKKGDRAEVITSPQSGAFYSEGGGQAGDKGSVAKEGALMRILNTCAAGGRKVIEVIVEEGRFGKGDKITLDLDSDRKKRTALNHTATHLLQSALRSVLGDSVKQSGSFVDENHLRFDFTYMKKLTEKDITRVENMVNGWIDKKIAVAKETKSLSEARGEGALSFFGDKYGDMVRVVSVEGISKELCGGTHADNTGEIKIFKIISESSVAGGIRRIEALTGDNAASWLRRTLEGFVKEYEALPPDIRGSSGMKRILAEIEAALAAARAMIKGFGVIDGRAAGVYAEAVLPAVLKMQECAGRVRKELKKGEEKGAFLKVMELVDAFVWKETAASGIKFIIEKIDGADMSILRKALAYAEKKMGPGVILLGGACEGKAFLVCGVTAGADGASVSAKKVIESAAGHIGGKGGGNDAFAQAGGRAPEGLVRALEEAERIITGKT